MRRCRGRPGPARRQPDRIPGVWIGYIPTRADLSPPWPATWRLSTTRTSLPARWSSADSIRASATSPSVLISHSNQCREAVARLGLPLFIKGAVRSRKHEGWKACVVESLAELEDRCRAYLARPGWTRGSIAVRKLVRSGTAGHHRRGFRSGASYGSSFSTARCSDVATIGKGTIP